MKKEIKALEQNETWSVEPLPLGKKAIDSKWVYKIKYKPDGSVERFKVRLVAKGFTQMEGVDYMKLCTGCKVSHYENSSRLCHETRLDHPSIGCEQCVFTQGLGKGSLHEDSLRIFRRK
ncbi:putative RNA-directed DNA polymerase [Helianthus annuus]|nr:putative RNA-directed DNA polymerase [Helianthus annuus]